MTSLAYQNFQTRLKEVQQLVDAHGALIRLRRAEDAHALAAGDMTQIGAVVAALVSSPAAGRPPQVQALNSAAITLLSGHLQGFITELFEEAARALLDDKVVDLDALIEVAPTQGNPNERNINRLFESIGFPKVVEGLSWNRMGNEALRRKLRDFNELRNRVAHGVGETVTKRRVENYMNVWDSLAKYLDRKIRRAIRSRTGEHPW